jgi:hypothetical protein
MRQTQVSCSNKHTYPNTQHLYPEDGSLRVGEGQEAGGERGLATPAKSHAGVYPPLSGRFSQPERVFLLVIKLGGRTGTGLKKGIVYFRYCKIFAKKINTLYHYAVLEKSEL